MRGNGGCRESEGSAKGCVQGVGVSLRGRRDELVISAAAQGGARGRVELY